MKKTMFLFALLLAAQTLSAQLTVKLSLTQSDGETTHFVSDRGRVYFDLVDQDLRVYTEDEDGNPSDWTVCNVSDVRSFELSAQPEEQLLMVVTDIYHATKVILSTGAINVTRQGDEWVAAFSPDGTQSIGLNLLRNILVENIGKQESLVPDTRQKNRVEIIVFEDGFSIKSHAPLGEVNVYTLSGQLQLSKRSDLQEMEVRHQLPKGLYIITAGGQAQRALL